MGRSTNLPRVSAPVLHAAMDIKQAVINVDSLLRHPQTSEVTRFIGGDMQRANRDHRASLLPSLIALYVSESVVGSKAQSIIHRIFAQRIHIFQPVIGQHPGGDPAGQPESPVHIANFSLAPDRSRDARCDDGSSRPSASTGCLHHDPAFFGPFIERA